MVTQFELDAGLCYLDTTAPETNEPIDEYNDKVKKAIHWINSQKETYLITEPVRNATSCILIEKGIFYGMGTLDGELLNDIDELKSLLTPYSENEVIRSMLRTYMAKFPERVKKLEISLETSPSELSHSVLYDYNHAE